MKAKQRSDTTYIIISFEIIPEFFIQAMAYINMKYM